MAGETHRTLLGNLPDEFVASHFKNPERVEESA